jgi:hypothetical protein
MKKVRITPAGALAALYLLGIAATAWSRLDMAWDSLAYHLPFAAIRAGIITYADHIIPAHHRVLLQGFPPVLDFIKGMLWRLTGHVEATQLFSTLVVGGGSLLAARLYGARWAVLILAVVAIPVGQVEFASNYTDLPVNFLLAFALFSAAHAITWPDRHQLKHSVATALALCLATTFKVTAIPFGVVIWAVYMLAAGFNNDAGGNTGLRRLRDRNLPGFVGVAFAGGLLAIGYGLVNLFAMGNPLFPVPVQIGPISLPGTVPTSNWTAAPYLAEVPRTVRWLVSVAEWHAFDLRPLPYIVAQGDVPETAMSYRMGGLFAYQLMFTSAVLVLLRNRIGMAKLAKVGALHVFMALVASMVPGSHEMRYFFFWYLSLLWSAYQLLEQASEDRAIPRIFVASLAASALYITLITGARYVYPFHDMPSADALVSTGIRDEVRKHLQAGELRFCVVDKDPYGFLYSRPFHEALGANVRYQTSADVASSACQIQPKP